MSHHIPKIASTLLALLCLAATGCDSPEERHFWKTAVILCKAEQRCDPVAFSRRFADLDACLSSADLGVRLYADRCEDFSAKHGRRCRRFLRRSARTCTFDGSDARNETWCHAMCSNYHAPSSSDY